MKKILLLTLCLISTAFTGFGQTTGLAEFAKTKYGLFVHYVWAGKYGHLTVDRNGKPPATMEAMANDFDVQGFANDVSAWGVEYVIFTAWHANINPLFPSETMKKWGMADHTCKRDLIGEIIAALKAKGIKVILYTHPRDGHDLRGDERINTSWGLGKSKNPANSWDPDWDQFDYKKWNDFNNELYCELMNRYGKDIFGLYLDEGSPMGDSYRVVDYPRLRQTIKSKCPHLVMIQNYYGNLYSCDVGDKEYAHWQEFANRDGGAWPGYQMPVGSVFAANWWAEKPVGTNTVTFTPEDMFRYTVLQAGVNTEGGGVAWAAGPYTGGGWETGVDETMRKVASYINPVATSIKGVYASKAFPTAKGAALKSIGWGVRAVEWGVATDAADGSATYIHVLNPPEGKTLHIGMPTNSVRFESAKLLANGEPVSLTFDAAGYVIILPQDRDWDKLDTVIRLQVGKNK